MTLGESTSAETAGAALVLVPVGSIEQHGPHLPLDTDTVIATAVSHGVAAELPGTWVAPPISYGASREHQSLPGTSSLGTEALAGVVVELARSMRTWAERVVFVNAHDGNAAALDASDEVEWVACATAPHEAHAGTTETSLMLRLRPESVRLELAEAVPYGVVGDSSRASAAEGNRLLNSMVADIAALLS
jgi:creatinine amidohydrolase